MNTKVERDGVRSMDINVDVMRMVARIQAGRQRREENGMMITDQQSGKGFEH